MNKPLVGLMPLWDDEKDSIWMLPGYMDGIALAGGLAVVLPFPADEGDLDQMAQSCDGFLFTGGHDVSPAIYHEKVFNGSVSCCRKRDEMEMGLLKRALAMDKPILGICRGLQFINAALGGDLYQDLPSQHPSQIDHRQMPPYDHPAHDVTILRDTPLYECLGTDILPVNSCHHQAAKTLAPGLRAMAVSPDTLTEALFMPDKRFLWAVQWHPEFNFRTDARSRRVFEAFIASMVS